MDWMRCPPGGHGWSLACSGYIGGSTSHYSGKVVAGLQFAEMLRARFCTLQRLSLVTGLTLIAQILGTPPAIDSRTFLRIAGRDDSQSNSRHRCHILLYSIGEYLPYCWPLPVYLGNWSGSLTPRVIAVILLLVAVMLTPTILNLIISEGTEISVLANLVFALVMLAVTFLAHRFLSGFWKSSLMLWSLIAGWLTFTALSASRMRP